MIQLDFITQWTLSNDEMLGQIRMDHGFETEPGIKRSLKNTH